ncbi:MAG: DUF6242 domain-containing protein [Prevotella sp.]
MRRQFYSLCMLLMAAISMASCLNSEDDTVYYDDAAITSFSLTGAKMTMHTTASTGDDSTYVDFTTDVASYNFVIDQLNSRIYNVDSLPAGTDPTKVICSYSTKNNSYAAIKSMTSDSLTYFSTSDSIDFSQPRVVSVFSTSGLNKKDYTITLNIHKETADSFQWKQYPDCIAMTELADMRSYSINGSIVVMGTSGRGTRTFVMTPAKELHFNEVSSDLGAEAYRNGVVNGNILYVLDGQTVKKTTDAINYTVVADDVPIRRLVAASSKEIYGLTADNAFMVSTDGCLTWTSEEMDSESRYVPREDLSFVCFDNKNNKNTQNVIVVGNRPEAGSGTDSLAVVWRKIVENDIDSKTGKWAYLNYDSSSKSPLKSLHGLSLVIHGDYIFALGGKGIDGCNESAYSAIYVSKDGGLSWGNVEGIAYPKGFDTSASAMSVCTDADNYIWITLNKTGQVWRGRLNEVAWQK